MAERALTQEDREWIAERASSGRELVAYLLTTPRPQGPVEPAILDRAFRAWRHEGAGPDVEPDAIVQGLGCLFGEYLVNTLNAAWVVVEDQLGTDLAVRELREGVLTYPLAAASKRLQSPPEELSFFTTIFDVLRDGWPMKAPEGSGGGA